MEMDFPCLLLLLTMLWAVFGSPDSVFSVRRNLDRAHRRRELEDDHFPVAFGPGGRLNLCLSFHHRSLNVYCHCSPTKNLSAATDAACWVYGDGENETSPIWDSFSTQLNLRHLNLQVREDSIHRFVPTKVLVMLQKLNYFELRYGTLGHLKSYAFANSTSLQELELSRNAITCLRTHSIARLPALYFVNLGENMISEVPREVFHDVPSLRKLFLDRNNISVVHPGAFEELTELEELELNENRITAVSRDTFLGLKGLQRLDLAENYLKEITDFTFSELSSLGYINLELNGMTSISEHAFEGLNELKQLNLSKNYLSTLPTNVLVGLTSINFLDIRTNRFNTLPFEVFMPVIENLWNSTSMFFLEENPLICDCRLAWLLELHNETSSSRTQENIGLVNCTMLDEGEDPWPGYTFPHTTTTMRPPDPARSPVRRLHSEPPSEPLPVPHKQVDAREHMDDVYRIHREPVVAPAEILLRGTTKVLLDLRKKGLPCDNDIIYPPATIEDTEIRKIKRMNKNCANGIEGKLALFIVTVTGCAWMMAVAMY